MPTLTTLAVFSIAALTLIVIPGPNIIYIMTRGIAQGRRAAVASALGVDTGILSHITAAVAGLSALLATSALAFNIVKYLGAAYLIYLGIRELLGSHSVVAESADVRVRHLRRAFFQGVVVSTLNPKVALFFLAFLPQFVDPKRGAATFQILLLGGIFFCIGLAVDLTYALSAGTLGRWLRTRPSFARWQRYFTGGMYLLLGFTATWGSPGRQRS